MGRGGEDALEWRKPFADKSGHFAQRASFDKEQQVVSAAHQVGGANFGKAADPLGDGIEPAFTLRRHFDFDDGGDFVQVEAVFIENGLVAAYNAALFVISDALCHFCDREIEHPGDVVGRFQGVGLQYA